MISFKFGLTKPVVIMKLIYVLLPVLLICLYANVARGQVNSPYSITGKLTDNKNKPLDSCLVELLKARDSAIVTHVSSNKNGEFRISDVTLGVYFIKISRTGYLSILRAVTLNGRERSLDIGVIVVEKNIELKQVDIVGKVDPVVIKKDSIEYDAGSFKTTPDANVEQLIKKMPGIDVDQAGNIKAQGEAVNRLTVDGRDFFGTDPKMATKNLPADAIAKVQVIDSQTKDAQRKGIDDGKREKVINLVLKEDKKGGVFGNVSVAGGTGEHYSASTSVNYFTDKKQVNLILLSNNINQGYAGEDVGNLMGMSVGGGSGEINGISFGRTRPGLTRINSGAFNFSDIYGKKQNIEFRATYNGGLTLSDVQTRSAIQIFQSNGTFFNTDQNQSSSRDQRHQLDINLYYQDSLLNISFSPTINRGLTNSTGISNTSTSNADRQLINNGYQKTVNNQTATDLSGYFSISRKFRQKRGAIALTINKRYNDNSIDNNNQNTINYYQNGLPTGQSLINQQQGQNISNSSLNVQNDISRTISRDRKTSLVLNSSVNISNGTSDQLTYNFNASNGLYDIPVQALTSYYTNKQIRYTSGLGFNKTNNKLTLSTYANLQNIVLTGTNRANSQQNEIKRNYWSFLPRATVSYKNSTSTSYSFNFSSSASAPSIQNLQPVQNNNNPLNIREGNSDLKVAESYNFQLGYNAFDQKKNISSNYRFSYGFVLDALSSTNNFDSQTGVTETKPINVNGNYNIGLNGSFGRPTGIKGLRLNYGFSSTFNRFVNLVNGVKNSTSTLTAGINGSLNYAYKESLNISFYPRVTYIANKNAIQVAATNNYFYFNNSANISYEFVKKWRLNIDAGQQSYTGRGDGFSNNIVIINAGIQKYFMEKNQLNLQLKAFDLFNQNSGISRNISNNRIEDIQVNNLRRYFSLRLTYKINKVGSK